jgi:phage tail-like protein
MVEFPVNPTRFDPYKNFKFRIKWDGVYIAGVSKVSALKRTTEVIEFRDGGDASASRKSPGRTEYDAITLERGLTQDRAFEDWGNMVWRLGAALGSEVALADFRKEVYLEFYNEAGQLVLAYKIYRCWPSLYQALPPLEQRAGRHRAARARERGLGARYVCDGAGRADLRRPSRLPASDLVLRRREAAWMDAQQGSARAGISFETRCCASLLRMRPLESAPHASGRSHATLPLPPRLSLGWSRRIRSRT